MRFSLYVGLMLLGGLGVPEAFALSLTGRAQETGGVASNLRGRGKEPEFVPLVSEAKAPAKLRQMVTLDAQGWSLANTLDEIARQLGLPLIYDTLVTKYERTITVKLEKVTGAQAVLRVLRNTGLQLEVAEDGSAARLRRTPVPHVTINPDTGETAVGAVTDVRTGQGIAGVEVLLEGTKTRAATDANGRYRLAVIDTGTYTLTARRVGYAKQSRRVTVRAEREDTVNFVLEPATVKLDELVTTATGQQRRRDLGNAITTIHADSVLQNAPIRNLTDLLETRVPGLTVQHTSGAPGDPARLRLRGLGSVLRSNDPVVVVDGVRLYAVQADQRSGNLTNAVLAPTFINRGRSAAELPAPSPLDQIDPNTIDKIEVFKGPSAATLYGADAANGVIVITTKRGRPGPTVWSARYTHGSTVSPGRYQEGYYRFGRVQELGDATVFCPLIEVRCTQDSLVRFQALNDPNLTILGKGTRNAFSLTASGGSQALTYSLTGSYDDEVGLLQLPGFEAERFRNRFNRDAPDWMKKPHHLKKWSVMSSVRALLGPSADVTLATTLSRSEQQRSSLEGQLSRIAGAYVDPATGFYYIPEPRRGTSAGGFSYVLNQNTDLLTEYYKRATASTINFTTGLNANWHPRSWLTIAGQTGLNVIPRDDQLSLASGLVAVNDSGAFIRGTGRSLLSTFNLNGAVRKPLRWGFVFETSVGANLTTTHTGDLVSSALGLVPGTMTLTGARTITAVERREDLSVFGWYVEPRITGQRFSLSTGIRLDGGSAYGARVTSLLGLPKLNGAWVVSEEDWFPFKTLFSSLKLRGAYGQAQVQPGVVDRLRLYAPPADGVGSALDLSSVGNVHLRPERSVEFEGGFDADLLDSRVTLEFTGYRKTQIDALMHTTLPGSVNGGGTVMRNIGNIRNKGVEVTLGLTPVRSQVLTWNMQLNYARNVNTLVELGRGVAPDPRQGLVAGYPVRSRWARPILGYADANEDGIIERGEIQVGDDFVYMGRLQPASVTTTHTNMVLFGGAVGISASFSYNGGAMQVDETARTNWVLARGLFDPSTPFSEQAAVLALDSTNYGLTQSVSTFRFNSLSVNYRAPMQVARLMRASQLTIAIQGANLAMHSSYRGKDPDVMAWGAGENIVDTGQLPQPRTWQLAVYLQY